MLEGFCDSKNPHTHVLWRQGQRGFDVYINGEFKKNHTTIDEVINVLHVCVPLLVKNPVRILGINVHNQGTIEVVDWVGKGKE